MYFPVPPQYWPHNRLIRLEFGSGRRVVTRAESDNLILSTAKGETQERGALFRL